jgi:transcriptional regulator with GAF, ATPase, and Fis domain
MSGKEYTAAHLIRLSDKLTIPLTDRLTTIGSSKRCKITINNKKIPQHCAYILFANGSYFLHPVDTKFIIRCNGETVPEPIELGSSSIFEFDTESFLFENTVKNSCTTSQSTPFHKLVSAIHNFFRHVSPETRFEMLTGIAQTLRCDGARLVVQDSETNGSFVTIARFPASSALDRYSERALKWALQQRHTVLMSATEWIDEQNESGSLEVNNIGSILCMPIISNDTIHGYLYLDRFDTGTPFGSEELEICDALAPIFGDILALYQRTQQQQQVIKELQGNGPLSHSVIFSCKKMKELVQTSCHFAKTDSTILLQGETGTGKEVFARLIHNNSNRSAKPFLVINCGAIPENLIESELFGHEKGAFTGATSRKQGLFEAAGDGTVFLDEIGELPINLQVKLLRVLQESEVLPVGATSTIKVHARIIAATNRNLLEEVEQRGFRKDLYYRLNVLRIEIPPLRERENDVLLISEFFIKKYSTQFGLSPKPLSLAAQSSLLKYNWPGNIRELENVVQKAVLISKGKMIEPEDITLDNAGSKQTNLKNESIRSLKTIRENAEKQAIIEALELSEGNVTVAANLLETDRKWLTKLITEYGISKFLIEDEAKRIKNTR